MINLNVIINCFDPSITTTLVPTQHALYYYTHQLSTSGTPRIVSTSPTEFAFVIQYLPIFALQAAYLTVCKAFLSLS